MSWFTDLWGGAPKSEPGPATGNYPDQGDLDAARAGDLAYGSGMEEYLGGERIKDVSGIRGTTSDVAQRVAQTPAGPPAADDRQGVSDLFMKGRIAAQRDPIAALGYDPSRMGIDRSGEALTIGGMYSPSTDTIWASSTTPSAIVHESIHRGLQQIKDSGLATPEQTKFLKQSEEYLVRRLMQTQMGDPEAAEAAPGDNPDQRQQASARYLFEKSLHRDALKDTVKQLHDIAYILYGQRRPALGHR